MNGSKSIHLGAQVRLAIKATSGPLHAAFSVGLAALARLGGGLGGGNEPFSNLGVKRGLHNGALPHQVGQVALEGAHVGIALEARIDGFASAFVHDILAIAIAVEEPASSVEKLLGTVGPFRLASVIGQDGSAVQVDATKIGIGGSVGLLALVADVDAVIDAVKVMIDQVLVPRPVPNLLRPLNVLVVVGGAGKAGSELEEAAVADAILVVEAVGVAFEDLPKDAAIAMVGVPLGLEPLEDVFTYVKPRGKVLVGLREVVLGSRQNGIAPEEEIIIAFLVGVLRRQVVVFGAEIDLGEECIEDDVVVAGVLGDMIVVNHHAPESTSHPPVVRTVDISKRFGIRGGGVALVI